MTTEYQNLYLTLRSDALNALLAGIGAAADRAAEYTAKNSTSLALEHAQVAATLTRAFSDLANAVR